MSKKQVDNIEQIRDLILGPQLREFQERFERFEEQLERRDDVLIQQTEASLEKLKRRINRSLNLLESRLDRCAETASKDRSKLKKMMHATDDSLREMLDQHKQIASHRMKRFRKEVREENRKRAKSVARLERKVLQSVSEQIQQLEEGKIARDEIAQVLLSAAMELQSTERQTLIEYSPDVEEKHPGKKNRKL